MKNNIFRINTVCLLASALVMFIGCDDILDVDSPKSKIPSEIAFEDDNTAISAATGMYVEMLNPNNYASGAINSVTALTSLSSDELYPYDPANASLNELYTNEILPQNGQILTLWTSAYKVIYLSNAILENVSRSTNLSSGVKDQLIGEALFVRAFTHFYLVNLFGSLPLITSTDYAKNSSSPRTPVNMIYSQIVDDLIRAQGLMSESYPSAQRVRPNKSAATALLSRVYLYQGDWANAEIQSSLIINDSRYVLESDLNSVFNASSGEAIWQLQQVASDMNTWEGRYFIALSEPEYFALNQDFVDSFESGDLRRESWIGSVDVGGSLVYFPFKYKVKYGGPSSNAPLALSEYSMVLRVAEQYLIRAEARTRLEKVSDAIADVDSIRKRAELPLLIEINPAISAPDLLIAIEREKRSEFFVEWGHRWLDMKRSNRASEILGWKAGWEATDTLYPIPDSEISKNPNLGDNNPGY